MNYLQWLLLGCISLLINGCINLGPTSQGPVNTYVLDKVNCDCIIHANKTSKVLLVTQPTSATAYSGTQMAYTLRPYQINYFANNRWAQPPARMLQPLIVEALQDTNHYKAVVSTPYIGNYKWRLDTELVELQQDFTVCPSKVYVILRARIIDAQNGKLVAAKEFCVCEQAYPNCPYAGAVAANEAVGRLLQKLAVFTVTYT